MIIGIDPDLSGGIAAVRHTGELAYLGAVPVAERESGSDRFRRVDPRPLKERVRHARAAALRFDDVVVMVERPVRDIRKSAGPSGFAVQHQNYGTILGIAHVICEDVREISPRSWKSYYGIGSDKEESLETARRLFPSHSEIFSVKKNHGMAEAALLARWGCISTGSGLR